MNIFNYWENIEVGEFVTAKIDVPASFEPSIQYPKGESLKVVNIIHVSILDDVNKERYFCKRVGVEDRFGDVSYFFNNKYTCSDNQYIGTWFRRKSYLLLMVSMLYYIIGR